MAKDLQGQIFLIIKSKSMTEIPHLCLKPSRFDEEKFSPLDICQNFHLRGKAQKTHAHLLLAWGYPDLVLVLSFWRTPAYERCGSSRRPYHLIPLWPCFPSWLSSCFLLTVSMHGQVPETIEKKTMLCCVMSPAEN